MSRLVVVSATLLVLLGCLRVARGVDYFWNKSNGGAFGVASNWSFVAGGPGDADDTVNFELDKSTQERYTVIGVNGQNNRLLVHNDALTLVLSDDYSLLSFGINPPSMVVGVANGEVGDVIIAGSPLGGVSSDLDTRRVVIGQSAGSTGVVSASNLRWNSSEGLFVGESGEGSLHITGGSNVTGRGLIGRAPNSVGSVTVSGAGSTWENGPGSGVTVGFEGDGTLTISEGGSVSGRTAQIGARPSSNSTATVTGGGSSWTTGNELIVGTAGTGSLTVAARGSVECLDGYIGQIEDSSGTVTVNGNGSSWAVNRSLVVGYFGDGALMVENGGDISNEQGWIGYDATASGDVTVIGPGSTWTNSEELDVGRDGTATLRIEAGGAVSNAFGSIASRDGSTGTVIVSGDNSAWTNGQSLSVGDEGHGTLTISAGGRVSNTRGFVGAGFDSTGVATVSGAESSWTNSGELFVGYDGTGTLTINSGADVASTNGLVGSNPLGVGIVTVAGTRSNWLNSGSLSIGHFGEGTLTVEAGAHVSNMSGTIGRVAGSTGAVIVRDTGSRWANGDFLRVGDEGEGTLRILSGGTVTNGDGRIAAGPGSTGEVIVLGADSMWTNSNTLNVGSIGIGTLTIESGGRVSNTNASIGSTSSANGIVTVTGPGSTWVSSGELRVGSSGTGRLTIQAGGNVSSADGILASTGSSTGRVTLTGAGSIWTIGGRLSIAGNAASGFSGGTAFLNIQPGGTVDVSQDTLVFPNGTLTLEGGTLATTAINFDGGGQFNWTSGTLHVGVFEGDLTNPPNGTLAPGRSAGSTTILGDYTQQAGAMLAIEIGGTATATQFDFVDVNGTATLGGKLELALINGFVPSTENQFVVLNAADDLLSFFTNVGNGQRLDTADGRASFLVHYGPTSAFNPNQIVLTNFLSMLSGDYNQNGTVDAGDYALWRDHLGSPTSLPNDDTPGVADDDYMRWRANFGRTVSGGSGASVGFVGSTAPEPSSLILLLGGISGITFSTFLVPKRHMLSRGSG
jgi:T5SS/PEP-CTERM-associated repeat protein